MRKVLFLFQIGCIFKVHSNFLFTNLPRIGPGCPTGPIHFVAQLPAYMCDDPRVARPVIKRAYARHDITMA